MMELEHLHSMYKLNEHLIIPCFCLSFTVNTRDTVLSSADDSMATDSQGKKG